MSADGARWGLWLAVVSCGCGPGEEVFEGVAWKSERVEYHARAGDPQACQGAVATIERRSDQYAKLMAVSATAWEPVEYYKYFDASDAEQGRRCDLSGRACAEGRRVYSTRAVHEHELAHVFYAGVAGEGPPFLEEGFAVGLTCDPSANATARDAPLETALDASTLAGYLAAGRLVASLWHAGTPSQFFELERRLGTTNPSVEQLTQQVQSVYDLDVRTLWGSARTDGPGCVAVGFCDAPPLGLGETSLRDSCRGRDARLVSSALGRALGVQSAGAPLVLRACDNGAETSPLSRLQLGGTFEAPWRTETWFVAPASDYALFQVEEDQGGADTNLRTRDLGGAYAPGCDITKPTPLIKGTEISIVVPQTVGTYHFALATEGPTEMRLSLLGSNPSELEVSFCRACAGGSAASCDALELSQPQLVSVPEPRALVVKVDEKLDKTTLLRLVPSSAL